MSVINTNVKSLVTQNALRVNNRSLAGAMEQLSTGKRINSAKDDAAGLAISSRMTAQIRGLDQAVRNANDGISLLQTAEGAMIEQTNMLQRMRELAVQSANDTNNGDNGSDRTALDTEYQALMDEIDRISDETEWNGMALLDGSYSGMVFHVGANAGQTISVTLPDMSTGDALTDIASGDILEQGNADSAITDLDAAIDAINEARAEIGATINRLTYAADNLANVSMNTSESRSRVLDTDYAKATTELARTQIIQQAATAMLAQANQQPQSVLSLLQ